MRIPTGGWSNLHVVWTLGGTVLGSFLWDVRTEYLAALLVGMLLIGGSFWIAFCRSTSPLCLAPSCRITS